jgi:biotin carboxylase
MEALLVLYRDFGPIYRLNLKAMAQAAREEAHKVLVVTLQGTAIGEHEADHVRFVDDFADLDQLSRLVVDLSRDFSIKAVLVAFESDVSAAYHCRELLGLEGPGAAFGRLVRDKNLMSTKAAALGVEVPRGYRPVTLSHSELTDNGLTYPVIVKPHDGMATKGVFKIDSREDLESMAIPQSEIASYRVEQFINSGQYHVDSIIRDGRVLFASISQYSVTPFESLSNADLFFGSRIIYDHSSPLASKLLSANNRIIEGFGFGNGVSHAEFFVDQEGHVVFGEIGARLPGAWVVNTIKEAYGIKMAREWVKCELNKQHVVKTVERKWVGGGMLKYSQAGVIKDLGGRADLAGNPNVLFHKIWVDEGSVVSSAMMSCDACGMFVMKLADEESVLSVLRDQHRAFQDACVISDS